MCDDRYDSEVLTTVNKALACELSKVQNELEQEVAKTDDLTAKLSKLSVRNTNKKLKCRDEKIVELKEQVKDQEKLHLSLYQAKTRVRSYQNRLTIAKNQYDTITQKCDHLQVVAKDLNKESHTIESKEHQRKYLGNVRQCCIELLSLNVGTMLTLSSGVFLNMLQLLKLKNCHRFQLLLACMLK